MGKFSIQKFSMLKAKWRNKTLGKAIQNLLRASQGEIHNNIAANINTQLPSTKKRNTKARKAARTNT
jgi:hypothetical protein